MTKMTTQFTKNGFIWNDVLHMSDPTRAHSKNTHSDKYLFGKDI